MAFGFEGPISSGVAIAVGDRGLVDYALSRTYRILNADRNLNRASCKVCGTDLLRDHGYKVLIAVLVPRTPKSCYLCLDCFTPVKTASEAFPLFTPLPSWWKLLDRKSVGADEKPPVRRLASDEIERRIKEKRRSRA